MQDKDEQLLKKRISELAALCYQRDIRSYTDFLTLNEQTIFHSMKRTLPPVTWLMGGGYETAERKIVCFLPSYEDETADLPISILEAVPASPRFAEALTHRDFLGAIMNLGISRSCIGDILMKNTRRKLVKSKFSVIVDYCMSCVCTALKTNYDVAVVCENIGNFTLALVAPVGTYNCFYHFTKLLFADSRSAVNKIYT